MNSQTIDPIKLESFFLHALGELSAGYGGVMVSLGSKLGLYKAMAGAGPVTSKELATWAGCGERYVSEWLNSQAAGGYVVYHAVSGTYELLPEQALVLADENSPMFLPSGWQVPASMWFDEDKTIAAFRSGEGVAWGEHNHRLHCGVAALYRNAYRTNLVPEWLPALDGVVDRLREGIAVGDVGCGYGHSTILMAEAFPKSHFYGFDVHAASIEAAERNAGTAENVTFQAARAVEYPERNYGLICFFDSLHDMGDPEAALRHAAARLAPGGTIMAIEPFANDRVEDNLSTIARMYYAGSAVLCCAHAISEGGKVVLGAQAGEAQLTSLFRKAGFTHVRRAAQTPFNLILEARV
jgi:SAM-dependent methyltransferase